MNEETTKHWPCKSYFANFSMVIFNRMSLNMTVYEEPTKHRPRYAYGYAFIGLNGKWIFLLSVVRKVTPEKI